MTLLPCMDPSQASGACFSGCRRYRYLLWRSWQPELGTVVFIALNPSTADAQHDDPTIRRCRTFAADWGHGAMIMVNLFDARATLPSDLKRKHAPVSRLNDDVVLHAASNAALIVAAWGVHGSHRGRSASLRERLHRAGLTPRCFGLTQTGEPLHPLYQRRASRADLALPG